MAIIVAIIIITILMSNFSYSDEAFILGLSQRGYLKYAFLKEHNLCADYFLQGICRFCWISNLSAQQVLLTNTFFACNFPLRNVSEKLSVHIFTLLSYC